MQQEAQQLKMYVGYQPLCGDSSKLAQGGPCDRGMCVGTGLEVGMHQLYVVLMSC